MKRTLLEVLACPKCKGELKLEVEEEGEEIMRGSLYCQNCHHAYPIVDGIPNLMPPEISPE
jgi:uncharacterized protein YbaR (Trm112 family)